jgi:hypothetical protein
MQVRTDEHTADQNTLKEQFEDAERSLSEGVKRFFKLFTESTFEGSRAAAQYDKICQTPAQEQPGVYVVHSLYFLICSSNSEMLSWPNSPLRDAFVDPNELFEGMSRV